MTRAADYTLLAKLGFADPDKRNQLHDLACQYVARPSVVEAMGLKIKDPNGDFCHLSLQEGERGRFECPVSKGAGRYRTTVGFVDVILPLCSAFELYRARDLGAVRPVTRDQAAGLESVTRSRCRLTVQAYVEVKIASVGLGEILRQIRLYEEYVGKQFWVLVAAFELSEALARGLKDEGVSPVQLGASFYSWAAAERARPRATGIPTV